MFERRRGGRHRQDGFTLVEVLIATTVLFVVMSAMGPVFYGAMRLTGMTDQRSQATHIAVAAIEQMRSLPYSEVGYLDSPPACTSSGGSPVVLSSAGPLDGLATTTVEGRTTFTVERCVYWSASSMPGTSEAYKQTVVTVSWQAAGGLQTLSQSSALYPGGYSPAVPATTTTTTSPGPEVGPTCTATQDAANPTSIIDLTIIPAAGTDPSSYLAYYTTSDPTGAITSGPDPYTTTQVPTTAATPYYVTVGPGTTYYFQVAAVWADGTKSAPSLTCSNSTTAPTETIYTSQASATALDMALGGSTTSYTVTSPPTSATNDGTGSDAPTTVQPTVAIPGADSFISVTGATQTAEASTDGSSYACAGLLSSGQTLGTGSDAGPCPLTGTGSGGISLDVAGLPGVGSAIGSLVAGLTLQFDGVTSWAAAASRGSPLTGSASLSGGTVTVTPLGGLLAAQTIPLSLPATVTTPTDCVQAMTTAIGTNAVVGSLAGSLQTALAPVLSLTCGYQTTSNGVLTESAMHISVPSGPGTADLAISSVGANTPHTVADPGPCSTNSLAIAPPGVASGSDVVLTSAGTLADGSYLQLSVNANSACSDVQVGYSLTGCTPGSAGCSTTYVAMTGTSGTYYGSAGTATTVWPVGAIDFVVFTGSPPAAAIPPTEQQITTCTEKGSTGQC